MLSWTSPSVPYYIEPDALAYCIYDEFYREAPHKSGTMRDGIQYQVLGNRLYFWNEVIYSNYQDKGCYNGAIYEGWWSEVLPQLFNYWLRVFEDDKIYKEV